MSNLLDDIDREHFFEWLRSIGEINDWDAAADMSMEPFSKLAHQCDDDMRLTVKRYKRLQELENGIDWGKNKHIWFLAFACHLERNQQAHTINGLKYEDGISWTIDMFVAWARNQNMNKIPVSVIKEFVTPCTDNIGCILRNEKECPVCDHKKVDISKHDYHMMETEDGPHGSDWILYRRNACNSWEVLMGESWESCYGDGEKQLEEIFQQHTDI